MSIKIADLLPSPVSLKVGRGELVLHPLTLSDIVGLLKDHKESFVAMYAAGSRGTNEWASFIAQTPDLVADVIATSAEAKGQQKDIKRLPGAVQISALVEIWNLSVPDAKKLIESLSEVTGGLQRLADETRNQTPLASSMKDFANSAE